MDEKNLAEFLNNVANGRITVDVSPERRYSVGYFNYQEGAIEVAITLQSGIQEVIGVDQFLREYCDSKRPGHAQTRQPAQSQPLCKEEPTIPSQLEANAHLRAVGLKGLITRQGP